MDHPEAVDRLVQAVLHSPGHTTAAERMALFRGEGAGPLGRYGAKVATASFTVTDADMAGLRDAGVSEDAILEATLAAALGAATAVL